MQLDPAELQAGDVEQLIDETSKAPRLALRELESLRRAARLVLPIDRALALGRASEPAPRDLDESAHRGERRAQLVRGDGEEVVARAHGLARLRVGARVLDGQRGAAPDLRRQDQVFGAVAGISDVEENRDGPALRRALDDVDRARPVALVERVPGGVVAGRIEEDERAPLRVGHAPDQEER